MFQVQKIARLLPNSTFPLSDFTLALDDALATASLAGRKLTKLSISRERLDSLGDALAALGMNAPPGELVDLFVGLPIDLLAAGNSSIAVIDDQDQRYCLG